MPMISSLQNLEKKQLNSPVLFLRDRLLRQQQQRDDDHDEEGDSTSSKLKTLYPND